MEIQVKGKKLALAMGGQAEPLEVSRVWASLVWPGEQPGYLLAGAQAKADGRLYLVAEHETSDLKKLIRACAAMFKSHKVSRFLHEGGVVGGTFRDWAAQLIRDEHLTGYDEGGQRLTLPFMEAPHADAPMFAAGVAKGWLEGKLVVTSKALKLFSRQLQVVATLQPDGVLEAMLGELYAFRALVMLVAAMDLWRYEATATTAKSYMEPADPRTGV